MARRYHLENFYDVLTRRGVRTQHQFQLELDGSKDRFGDLELYCQSANLPGRQQVDQPISYHGFNFNVPSNLTYDTTLNLTFFLDTNLEILDAFNDWADDIANLAEDTGGMKGRVPTDNIRLMLLDNTLKDEVKTYVLVGAYPSNIGQVTLNQGSNSIQTIDITMKFQYWYDEENKDPFK